MTSRCQVVLVVVATLFVHSVSADSVLSTQSQADPIAGKPSLLGMVRCSKDLTSTMSDRSFLRNIHLEMHKSFNLMLSLPPGLDSVLTSFLDKSLVNQTQTALASNLLGIVNAVETTPAISLPSLTVVNGSDIANSAQGSSATENEALQNLMRNQMLGRVLYAQRKRICAMHVCRSAGFARHHPAERHAEDCRLAARK